jgi:hypothetical protein
MLMGAPTEIYLFGTLYWLVSVAVVFVAVAINYIYLPVFYELQLTSTYEVRPPIAYIIYFYVAVVILTEVAVMSTIFWDITLCNPLKGNRCF